MGGARVEVNNSSEVETAEGNWTSTVVVSMAVVPPDCNIFLGSWSSGFASLILPAVASETEERPYG